MRNFKRFLKEGIEKRGDNFVVTDSSGDKVLGTHDTKKMALKQLAAVEISKKEKLKEGRVAVMAGILGIALTEQYTVKSGDTLSQLAQKHGTTVADLAKLNNIADPNKIQVGQTINFRAAKPAAPEPKTPSKPAQTSTQKDCYGDLCLAIQRAETGSEKDPFIRTRYRPKGGSTAYGPGQITGQTLRDFNTRHPGEFTEVKDYMGTLIDQSREFARYGAEPNKPGYEARFDYGGSGNPAAKDPEKYNVVQRGVLRGMAKDLFGEIPSELTKDQRERLVTRYRGATRTQDPRYFKEVDKSY